MSPQTDYFVNQFAAQAGQVYDLGENDVVSGISAVDVGYGLALVRDATSDQRVALPASSGDVAKFVGVSALTMTNEQPYQGSGVPVYKAGKPIPLMHRGRIWVQVEEAVAKGDQAFVRYATGSGTVIGAFRKSADTSTAAALKNGVFFTASQLGRDGVTLFAVLEVANPTTASS